MSSNPAQFGLLKPRYHEAVFRLKNSTLALIALVTATHLLPLPTPHAFCMESLPRLISNHHGKGVSLLQLSLFCLLLVNILQSAFAIRSPPTPYPPLPSPSKRPSPAHHSKGQHEHRATPPSWRTKSAGSGLSPNTTPQRQLAFSTSAGGGSIGGASASAGSASDPRGLARSYALAFDSPLHDLSLGSSTGSLPSSPSPAQASLPLAAYRGRRAPTGRALDGSLLARLAEGDSDSDLGLDADE
ncbi:hypothetical protein F5148DRAFT_1207698 [Russula earlei]|uniref:Uncharacterized protein n=1 Tax=Russula earlei TaxID=71964 RepID=A0ACC0U7T7_9AGAM|nr:hypothetical protein F5148DRAFT_1207698 [Russula earlei]